MPQARPAAAADTVALYMAAGRAAEIAAGLIAQGLPAADALRESRGDASSDLDDAERAALRRALSRTNGNVSQAAQILGISRATLHRKIKRFSLQ